MGAVRNATTGAVIASRVERASTFLTRLIGLLAWARVEPDEGLWIEPCSAVHTIGMRARIDVVFVDRQRTVLRVCKDVGGGVLALGCKGAHAVVEVGAGALGRNAVSPGDQLDYISTRARVGVPGP